MRFKFGLGLTLSLWLSLKEDCPWPAWVRVGMVLLAIIRVRFISTEYRGGVRGEIMTE